MQASPAEHRSYLWSVPGKRVEVDVALEIVGRLASDVREGLPETGRGIEVGGLLLGHIRRENGLTVAVVEDAEPLECEHAAGPSFMLSAADRQLLEARLRRHRGSVVGFYRSNTRKEFAITVEDVALMSWYFPDASKVLLLIHAGRDEQLRGAFVTWEGRTMAQKSPGDEFPFDRAPLVHQSHAMPARVVSADPPAAKRKPVWLAAAAVAIGLGLGALYEVSVSSKSPLPPAPSSAPGTVAKAVTEPVAAPSAPEAPLEEAPVASPPIVRAPHVPSAPPPPTHTADRRLLDPPPLAIPVAREAELVDPPRIDAPPVAVPAEVLATLSTPAAPSPPPAPIVTVPPASVSLNAITRGRGPKFVPPTAVRQVRPEIPGDLRARLRRDVQVQVKVYIDQTGRVSYAELLSDGVGENRELASLAVFASRRWLFAPANRDGKPVEAEAVLRFRFSP